MTLEELTYKINGCAMKISLILLFILEILLFSCSQSKQEIESKAAIDTIATAHNTEPTDEIPKWAIEKFDKDLHNKYGIADFLSPNFLIGDFNGDKLEDVALLIINLKTNEKGLTIIHKNEHAHVVFGAGQEVNGMKELDWIGIFKKIEKGNTVAETLVDETGDIIGPDKENEIVLKSDAIYLHIQEAGGGGIIYYDIDKYKWLHIE